MGYETALEKIEWQMKEEWDKDDWGKDDWADKKKDWDDDWDKKKDDGDWDDWDDWDDWWGKDKDFWDEKERDGKGRDRDHHGKHDDMWKDGKWDDGYWEMHGGANLMTVSAIALSTAAGMLM